MLGKPFIAVQRVQLPPGKGQPANRKRVLHVAVATPLLKRRQQVLKPRGSLDINITPKPLLSVQQGQHGWDRHWRGTISSAGVADRGKGTGRTAWEPGRSCSEASCRSSGCESHQRRGPATAVVISSGGEGDQTVESLDVKVPDGWETGRIRAGGRANWQAVANVRTV